MAASPYRCTITLDGAKFDAVSANVQFTTEKDRAGMPHMGSLKTSIRVIADLHDDKNLPFSTIKKFFDLANVVTRDKIKDIKIEYWKDDSHQDALFSYSFKGWLSRFQTSNPHPVGADGGPAGMGAMHGHGGGHVIDGGTQTSAKMAAPAAQLNHVLILDLEPALNQENFTNVKATN